MNVRYSKGVREDGGGRQERLVDIYESADTFRDNHVDHSTLDGGTLVLNTFNFYPLVFSNSYFYSYFINYSLVLKMFSTACISLHISNEHVTKNNYLKSSHCNITKTSF